MIERFTLGKDYDCDGCWEYCYEDNETGRRFNFADDYCHTDFLELVNAVIDDLRKENKELKIKNDLLSDELEQAKAVIHKKWDEYLKKKELEE